MLFKASKFKGYGIEATDGDIGEVRGFYFDENNWDVYYMIIDAGSWYSSNTVILSTQAIDRVDSDNEKVFVNVTRDRIKNSPQADEDEPLSPGYENRMTEYYGWSDRFAHQSTEAPQRGRHYLNTHDVMGHYVEASDGSIGHIEDFIIDDADWSIRYMVVDTKNWWPGKKVLISPQWVSSFDWNNEKVFVDMTKDKIKSSPEYDPDNFDRNYEDRLYTHYGRQGYWHKDRFEKYESGVARGTIV